MVKNCWEFRSCGRQPGGDKVEELGICPVAMYALAHGINDGINGGRACWVIEGSLCGSKVQGNYTQKLSNCLNCEFYDQVRKEQGREYIGTKEILDRVKNGAETSSLDQYKTDVSSIRNDIVYVSVKRH